MFFRKTIILLISNYSLHVSQKKEKKKGSDETLEYIDELWILKQHLAGLFMTN